MFKWVPIFDPQLFLVVGSSYVAQLNRQALFRAFHLQRPIWWGERQAHCSSESGRSEVPSCFNRLGHVSKWSEVFAGDVVFQHVHTELCMLNGASSYFLSKRRIGALGTQSFSTCAFRFFALFFFRPREAWQSV